MMMTESSTSSTGSQPRALGVYGTMRPGEANHWVVRDFGGEWSQGTVQGWQFEITWGAAQGYPGVILDPNGQHVPVAVLHSEQLHKHIHKVDDFEGPGYRRVVTPVELGDGEKIDAWVYEARQDAPD